VQLGPLFFSSDVGDPTTVGVTGQEKTMNLYEYIKEAHGAQKAPHTEEDEEHLMPAA
jgi:hypothetical protein